MSMISSHWSIMTTLRKRPPRVVSHLAAWSSRAYPGRRGRRPGGREMDHPVTFRFQAGQSPCSRKPSHRERCLPCGHGRRWLASLSSALSSIYAPPPADEPGRPEHRPSTGCTHGRRWVMSRTTPVSAVSGGLQSLRWPRQTRNRRSSRIFYISPVSACPAASRAQSRAQNGLLTCGISDTCSPASCTGGSERASNRKEARDRGKAYEDRLRRPRYAA
jgi:hypothetical protein